MKILRLELVGFKRLILNNIERLVYTPTQPYQLILGTNGSGKSSVLMELSPLPAHSSNYAKDGLKDILIEHQGKEYHLISSFKTGKHSFLVDGEELNPGGTGEVQKKLVEQHFNFTKELRELLTGEVLFTDMSPIERRKWITELSNINYDYALGLFKKISTIYRDQQGASKHLKGRLATEHVNLKSLGSIDGLEQRSVTLRDELDALMFNRSRDSLPVDQIERQLRSSINMVIDYSKKIIDGVYQLRGHLHACNYQELKVGVTAADQELSGQRALVNRLSEEYTELETAIHGFKTSDGITPDNIDGTIIELEGLIAEQKGRLNPEFAYIEDTEGLLQTAQSVVDQVIQIFTQLPDNSDRRYTKSSIEQAKKDFDELSRYKYKLDAAIMRDSNKIAMIESTDSQTCPSCQFTLIPGVEAGALEALKRNRKEMADKLEEAEVKLKTLSEYLEDADHTTQLYGQLRALWSAYPRMKSLWDYISTERLHLIAPYENTGKILHWFTHLENCTKLESMTRRLDQLKDLASQWSQAGGVGHLGQRMNKIMAAIEAQTRKLHDLREIASDRNAALAKVNQLDNILGQLNDVYDQVTRQYGSLIETYRNREIDRVIAQHHNELGGIQRKLTEYRSVEGVVNDLESSLGDVGEKLDSFKYLVNALSPTDGLIAKQLTSFIGCLTEQINSITSSIWEYDIQVLPCGMESGGLDYKFPVQIKSSGNRIPDISKGSKAQKHLINLAFQQIVMLYKNMTDYPLYLDEPGEGFDEQHRSNLMAFIKRLMDNNYYSQLFMISHYASSHGAFSEAQVMVLDSTNIALTREFNQHVVLG